MSATQYSGLFFAPINAVAATGTLVAAVAKKSIVVVHAGFEVHGSATASVAFRSGASTLLTGPLLGGTLPIAYTFDGTRNEPLFSTASGASLDLLVAGATPSINGFITYFLEDAQ